MFSAGGRFLLYRVSSQLGASCGQPGSRATQQQPRGSHPATPQIARLMCAGAGAGFNSFVAASRAGLNGGGLALLGGMGGGAAVAVYAWGSSEGEESTTPALRTSRLHWVQQLAASGEEMSSPGMMLREHPVGKLFTEQDHLFETMRGSGQIHEFRCFYEAQKRKFHSVVQLGKDVCGFPATVHGGLSAAIIDDSCGGLAVCLWKTGALGFRLPAYTARLEVDYKKKIPSGSVILCTAELEKIEGRKVWMRAHVTDGQGTEYATARALFVAPRLPGENLTETLKRWVGAGRS